MSWNSDLARHAKSGRERNENLASTSQLWHRNENPHPSIGLAAYRVSPICIKNLNVISLSMSMTMTMTMTMTHSEKSHIRRMKAWPYKQECRGHDPTRKQSVALMRLALLARCALLRTVCSTSSHEMNSKEHVTTHRLLLEWIHEFKSLESSDSEQHNKEVRETKRGRASQGNQEKTHPKRKLASTVAHQSLLSSSNQNFLLWYEEVVLRWCLHKKRRWRGNHVWSRCQRLQE